MLSEKEIRDRYEIFKNVEETDHPYTQGYVRGQRRLLEDILEINENIIAERPNKN